jgi:hypothetical protein
MCGEREVFMRRLVAAITCFAFTGSVAFAQVEEPAPPPPPAPAQQQQPPYAYPPQQPPTYTYPPEQPYPARPLPGPEQIYRSGRRQRAVGMLLTVLGIGLGALGAALLYDSEHHSTCLDYDDHHVLEGIYGFLFTMMGIGSFIPGLVLWVHGESKMIDALQMGASGMTLAPTPRVAAAPGLTLQWRF